MGESRGVLSISWVEAFLYGGIQSVKIVRIEIMPNDRVYGSGAYSTPVNRIVYSDS